jgi:release factor glutamine methyltransferase
MEEISARLMRHAELIVAREVGTGSGAVAVALGLRFRAALTLGRLQLTATDSSPDALTLARDNLAANALQGLVTLSRADLLDPVATETRLPDVVVANLPYLTSAQVASGNGSLRYEPKVALDGGADGLDLIRRLVAQLPARLAPGGTALLEVGDGQAAAVRAATEALPVRTTVTTGRDLGGVERVVRIERAGSEP